MCRSKSLTMATHVFLMALVGIVVRADAEPPQPSSEADYGDELPRIAPVEPAEALATFQTRPGFHLELVAAEPLVADPVAAAFDEEGRLYVVEMRGYSEQPDEALSRVRRLEDTDGDGRFDASTVFLDKLSWPTAIICYDGGVFVADAPDILRAKDTDGDGQADEREVVLTGFGKSNVQGLVNSFVWGLDNRIHGATSSSGGQVRRPDPPQSEAVNLNGRDFAFDPRTLKLTATSGGAQHGMSFDAWGRKFVCSNSDHIQQVMYEDRYLARNPYLIAPGPRVSIAADGPQAEVYRISPVESWRIVRTRLRVAGAVGGPIEGGGRAAGYFTGATGVTIYRGDAWPVADQETAVVGDVGGNLVHRKRLEPHGLEFVARRIDEQSELVASRDIWFRPAQFLNAPDGTLWILDVYREVIEHPASLPPAIKRHLDLTSGRDRGRIYRIVPDGFDLPPVARLSPFASRKGAGSRGGKKETAQATTAELVAALEHTNGWHRETAARLLFERRDPTAGPLLTRLAGQSESPLGRMHALHALAGLDLLTSEIVLAALDDEHPGVREHAVRLSERFAKGDSNAQIVAKLQHMAADGDLRVRYQLAFTLGEFPPDSRLEALAALIRHDAGDRWMRLAIQSSLGEGADQMLARLSADEKVRTTPGVRELLESLARQIGLANRPGELAAVWEVLGRLTDVDRPAALVAVRGLGAGVSQRGGRLADLLAQDGSGRASETWQALLSAARRTAVAEQADLSGRVEAIRLLTLDSFAGSQDVFEQLLNHRQPAEVQSAALESLAAFDDEAVAPLVLAAWPALGPRARAAAAETLFARPRSVRALLAALSAGEVHAADIDLARLKLLAAHADAGIRKQAEQVLASLKLGRRSEVVEAHRDVLDLAGDRERGQAVFAKVCAACHRLGNVGHELGPNLATIKNRGADAILVNMLDPSREANPQFVNYLLITDDGRTFSGMLAAETANSVTLRRAEGASDTVPRAQIDELRSTGLSLMPEGLEQQLTKQQMADLIAYLLSL